MRKGILLVLGASVFLNLARPAAAEMVGCTISGASDLHLLGSSRTSEGHFRRWEVKEAGQPITIRCDELGDLSAGSGIGVRIVSKPGEEDQWRCELRFASILAKGSGEVTVRMRADRKRHFADYEGNWKDVGDLRCTVTKGDLRLEFDGNHHLVPAAAQAEAAAGLRFSMTAEQSGFLWDRALPLDGDSAALVFRARGGGIHVKLAAGKSDSAEAYEAVIEYGDERQIRKRGGTMARAKDAQAHETREWMTYWFSVSRGFVRLGRGEIPGREVLLEWQDPKPLKDLRWAAFWGGHSRLELRAVRLAAVGEGGEGPPVIAAPPASPPAARPPAEVTLPSSLRYLDLVQGQGAPAKIGDDVELAVTVRVSGGSQDLEPRTTHRVVLGGGRMIEGFDEGVVGMQPGGKRRLQFPAALHGLGCYGCKVPPNLDLIMEVELLSLTPGAD